LLLSFYSPVTSIYEKDSTQDNEDNSYSTCLTCAVRLWMRVACSSVKSLLRFC